MRAGVADEADVILIQLETYHPGAPARPDLRMHSG
jgi:hypothetical protein